MIHLKELLSRTAKEEGMEPVFTTLRGQYRNIGEMQRYLFEESPTVSTGSNSNIVSFGEIYVSSMVELMEKNPTLCEEGIRLDIIHEKMHHRPEIGIPPNYETMSDEEYGKFLFARESQANLGRACVSKIDPLEGIAIVIAGDLRGKVKELLDEKTRNNYKNYLKNCYSWLRPDLYDVVMNRAVKLYFNQS